MSFITPLLAIRDKVLNPPQTPQTGNNHSPPKMTGREFMEMLKTKISFYSKGCDLAGRATLVEGSKAQDSALKKCESMRNRHITTEEVIRLFFPS
jgi:hypothetical protein